MKRPPRPAWTGSSRRTPSTRPPVLSPKELALTNGATPSTATAASATTVDTTKAAPEPGPGGAPRGLTSQAATRNGCRAPQVLACGGAAFLHSQALHARRNEAHMTDPVTLDGDGTIGEYDEKRAENAVRELLIAVGEDPDREGLRETPARVARGISGAAVRYASGSRGRPHDDVRPGARQR